MTVEEQVHGGRSQAADRPRPARQDQRPLRRPALRPVVAAAVVLLLWLVWLALPRGYGGDGSAAAQATLAGQGRDVLAAVAPGARPVAGPDGPAPDGGAAAGAVGPWAAGPSEEQAVDDEAVDDEAVDDEAVDDEAVDDEAVDDEAVDDEAGSGAATESSSEPSAPAPAAPVEVPQRGAGTFGVAPGSSEPVGQGSLVRYSVEVEAGVPLDPAQVGEVVDGVLADPRSWTGDGSWSLQRVDADPDMRIRVTSPDTTDELCAPLNTGGRLSCRNGPDIVLNALRWTEGAESWGSDLTGYRQYLVNHEVGHFLGQGHVRCPGPGQPAPVMLQQTLGLEGCTANAWPNP